MMVYITACFLKSRQICMLLWIWKVEKKPEGWFPFHFWYLNATVITEHCKELNRERKENSREWAKLGYWCRQQGFSSTGVSMGNHIKCFKMACPQCARGEYLSTGSFLMNEVLSQRGLNSHSFIFSYKSEWLKCSCSHPVHWGRAETPGKKVREKLV